jgi:hypothetical protein
MPRIIYSLLFWVEPDDPPPAGMCLVANLDRSGNSEFCRPCAPKARIIDFRAGDSLHHVRSGRKYRILAVSAYRDSIWDVPPPDDYLGYVVRVS